MNSRKKAENKHRIKREANNQIMMKHSRVLVIHTSEFGVQIRRLQVAALNSQQQYCYNIYFFSTKKNIYIYLLKISKFTEIKKT